MKKSDFIRPDKLFLKGLLHVSSLPSSFYMKQKTEAKAKGEFTFIGEKKTDKTEVQLITFNKNTYAKQDLIENYDFIQQLEDGKNYWLNFTGIHEVDLIQEIGEIVHMDRMTIRRILDTTQRPKIESYENYLFFSVKSVALSPNDELEQEQLSFVLADRFVISFQEKISDRFTGIRHKLEEGLGLLRTKKCDYLLSQLIDSILDNYFETIEKLNQKISILERDVYSKPSQQTLLLLESYKNKALQIKKAIIPLKEALQHIVNTPNKLILKSTKRFYKDLLNYALTSLEEADTTLKTIESLTNIYFASLSQKMNEVMKVLTIVSTIFIPMTFIAGIYGMNFNYMPELQYKYGYHLVLLFMGIITVSMIIYFKIKKWI